MHYKAVIFDLDGTLLDTISDISDSVNEVLRNNGYKEFGTEDYKYFVGKGVDVLIHTIIEKDNIPKEMFSKIRKEYIETYDKRSGIKTKPYSGIMSLLSSLHENNVRINILSNKPHHQVLQVVYNYFQDIDFDFVYGKKPEFEIKPNPTSVLEIVDKLGVKKEEILYVGDTSTDMLTAFNANLDSVGVLWGFRKRPELEEAHAKYIVKEPTEILDIVLGDTNDN
jgi:phosphoglycolate phosphatase